jgi:hypothetical protein
MTNQASLLIRRTFLHDNYGSVNSPAFFIASPVTGSAAAAMILAAAVEFFTPPATGIAGVAYTPAIFSAGGVTQVAGALFNLYWNNAA